MSFSFLSKKGKSVTLLNPSEKAAKAAKELKLNCRFTNDGEVKKNSMGGLSVLTPEERAYRAGYLDARKDGAKAYKAKNKSRKG